MAKRLGNTNKLWILWGVMYALCAVCGFLPKAGAGDSYGFLVMIVGMAFFIPPTLVILYSVNKKRKKPLEIIRNLSIASLSLTLVMMLLNMLSVYLSTAVGDVLDFILRILSVPMACMPISVLSLFGWACLLMTSLNYLYAEKAKRKYSRHRRHRSKK